jgi:hypothetical protein
VGRRRRGGRRRRRRRGRRRGGRRRGRRRRRDDKWRGGKRRGRRGIVGGSPCCAGLALGAVEVAEVDGTREFGVGVKVRLARGEWLLVAPYDWVERLEVGAAGSHSRKVVCRNRRRRRRCGWRIGAARDGLGGLAFGAVEVAELVGARLAREANVVVGACGAAACGAGDSRERARVRVVELVTVRVGVDEVGAASDVGACEADADAALELARVGRRDAAKSSSTRRRRDRQWCGVGREQERVEHDGVFILHKDGRDATRRRSCVCER